VLEPDATDPAVAGALDVLALTTSVSYLKATLPARVEVGGRPVGPAGLAMLRALLTDGLAELALRAGLGPLAGTSELVALRPATEAVAGAGAEAGAGADAQAGAVPSGVLVTVGGGKDSALTLALAARHDPGALAVAVNPRAPMERTAAWAGLGLVRIERRLDRTLLDLNARGAINGHVPITAIVTSAAAVAAAMLGRGTVLVSNERSADHATREVDGWVVNHQYSKTAAFERLLGAALVEAGARTRVVSLLRPLSELAIARGVAREPGLVAQVTSCNAAFALDGPGDGWCGACDKCRFVQLALAPFTDRARLVADLGFDALADPAQVDGFARMLDAATKPFECVGTVDEVRLALDLLAAEPTWRDAAAVRALADPDAADLAGRLAAALRPDPTVVLPAPFDRWLAGRARRARRGRDRCDGARGGPGMIVVLGHGRETRAWLARRPASDARDVLVLDEAGGDPGTAGVPAGTSDGTPDGTSDGVRLAVVDLDDVAAVRAAVGDRRVEQVVRSPGVSPYRPGPAWLVGLAPCATPTGLWLADAAPDDLVALTGTKGKSTATAMTAHLLRAAGRDVVLAGNIGVALTTVDAAASRDDLVVELSSYQLADLTLGRPAVAAAVTTLFADHVPWHGSVERYHADKLRLLGMARWRVVGQQVARLPLAAGRFDATAGDATPEVAAALAEAGLHGAHEGQAAMLALALAARRLGTDALDLVGSLATFTPLPHRLRPVATVRGRTFVDDSIATVPEATLAALATWRPRGPVTLLLGGEDRGQDLTALVAALADPDVRAALLPPFGTRLADAVRAAAVPGHAERIVAVADLAAAVAWADVVTPAGGAVLLSPAAPSFGAFRDFVHRGETFAALVAALAEGRVDGTEAT
jgi:UDP-N-acetylmuramoylalanine-D-glutamate ligase